jgi:hypothetical protein
MGNLKHYILKQNFNAPYVVATGLPHNPSAVKVKKFKKGEIVKGELKHSNGQPAFILVQGTLVFPLSVVRKVVTKEVSTAVDGTSSTTNGGDKTTVLKKSTDPRVRYVDSALIGAVVGFGLTHIAEKQGWVSTDEENPHKNRVVGAILGAAVGAYLVYKKKTTKTLTIKNKD